MIDLSPRAKWFLGVLGRVLRVTARLSLYFLATVGAMICAAVWLADLGDLGLPTYAFLHGVVRSAPMLSVFCISMVMAARGGPEWLWQ